MIQKNIFLFVFFLSFNVFAEFENTGTRYISGYDFELKLKNLFVGVDDSTYRGCFEYINIDYGFNLPATGSPMSSLPSKSTVNGFRQCLVTILNKIFIIDVQIFKQQKNLVTDAVLQKILSAPSSGMINLSVFTEQELMNLVSHIVENILGVDDVIKSYGIIDQPQKYKLFLYNKYKNSIFINYFMVNIISDLALRDEFLMY